jgi:hypothetical protein
LFINEIDHNIILKSAMKSTASRENTYFHFDKNIERRKKERRLCTVMNPDPLTKFLLLFWYFIFLFIAFCDYGEVFGIRLSSDQGKSLSNNSLSNRDKLIVSWSGLFGWWLIYLFTFCFISLKFDTVRKLNKACATQGLCVV